MTFEYGKKFYESMADELDFSNLRDGASMTCADQEQAHAVVGEFNKWAFKNRSPYIAVARKPSITEGGKRNSLRVWIIMNERGPDALMPDDIGVWIEERVEYTSTQPVSGWLMARDFYDDFIAWSKYRGLNEQFRSPKNTFTQHIKHRMDAQIKRRAEGMIVVGAVLKKTDLEKANDIDPDPV